MRTEYLIEPKEKVERPRGPDGKFLPVKKEDEEEDAIEETEEEEEQEEEQEEKAPAKKPATKPAAKAAPKAAVKPVAKAPAKPVASFQWAHSGGSRLKSASISESCHDRSTNRLPAGAAIASPRLPSSNSCEPPSWRSARLPNHSHSVPRAARRLYSVSAVPKLLDDTRNSVRSASTTLASTCGWTRPTVVTRRSSGSSALLWKDTGLVSVMP